MKSLHRKLITILRPRLDRFQIVARSRTPWSAPSDYQHDLVHLPVDLQLIRVTPEVSLTGTCCCTSAISPCHRRMSACSKACCAPGRYDSWRCVRHPRQVSVQRLRCTGLCGREQLKRRANRKRKLNLKRLRQSRAHFLPTVPRTSCRRNLSFPRLLL